MPVCIPGTWVVSGLRRCQGKWERRDPPPKEKRPPQVSLKVKLERGRLEGVQLLLEVDERTPHWGEPPPTQVPPTPHIPSHTPHTHHTHTHHMYYTHSSFLHLRPGYKGTGMQASRLLNTGYRDRLGNSELRGENYTWEF